jgi:hypothetical protein
LPDTSPADEDKANLTGPGCVLTLLAVAVIFAVAIPAVQWRDRETGRPLPRVAAIFGPVLIGGLFHGLGSLLLRLLGIPVWKTPRNDDDLLYPDE